MFFLVINSYICVLTLVYSLHDAEKADRHSIITHLLLFNFYLNSPVNKLIVLRWPIRTTQQVTFHIISIFVLENHNFWQKSNFLFGNT